MSREELLRKVICAINSFAEEQEAYYTEDKANPFAESLFWQCTEGDYEESLKRLINDDDTDETIIRGVEVLMSHFSGDVEKVFATLVECSEAEFITPHCAVSNALDSSGPMGEVAEQLPEEIKNQLTQLTDEEREKVERRVDAYIDGDHVYLSFEGCCWALIVDEGRLTEQVKELAGVDLTAEEEAAI